MIYRVVQPWGRKRGVEATLISEHTSINDAFATIDRIALEILRTGAAPQSIELLVVDEHGEIQSRPDLH